MKHKYLKQMVSPFLLAACLVMPMACFNTTAKSPSA